MKTTALSTLTAREGSEPNRFCLKSVLLRLTRFQRAEPENNVGAKLAVLSRPRPEAPILWWHGIIYALCAGVLFYLAYSSRFLSWLMAGYLFCLIRLAGLLTGRRAFYFGLATGLLTAIPQLDCFWTIFGPAAIVLWLVLAFWIGLFVALVRMCRLRLPAFAPVLVPFVWTGLEYFRSELYYLRFSWLNVGYAFAANMPVPGFHLLGMYGMGFVVAAVATAFAFLPPVRAGLLSSGAALLFAAGLMLPLPGSRGETSGRDAKTVTIAGVQLEFPAENEVVRELNGLIKKYPEAKLIVLSEYTLMDSVPDGIRHWCRDHGRYLIIGGKEPTTGGDFYNTAFVIGPQGDVVFRQAKCVPIQFFKDGLPAKEQALWESPWGRIGICICYDLSYTRVTDRLIRQGAQGLIVPTMDVVDWGWREHELHTRVAPVRAAEYGIPIFRLASSGISQLVDGRGVELARAGFPGERETIMGVLRLGRAGSRPLDRWLAPGCLAVVACLLLHFVATRPGRRASSSTARGQEHNVAMYGDE